MSKWLAPTPRPPEDDAVPARSYEDKMQQEAYAAFGRMVQRMEMSEVPGVPVEFTVTAQFWADLLKIMEYAVLKNPPK